MKKIGILFCALITFISIVCAQSPQAFKYQAVARDNAGILLSDKEVGLRISIIQESINGATVYSETHHIQTNKYGLINLEIGKGLVVYGTFNTINWGSSTYFVKIEIDADGGNNYSELGISQLMSVPYALYAQNAGNVKWETNENKLFYNSGNIGIGTDNPQVKLHLKTTSQNSLLRLESGNMQSGLQLISSSDYNPFINFGANGTPGSKGGIYCDLNNNQIILRANYDFSQSYELVLQNNGNLGVGKKFPAYKLDVAGDLNFTGDIFKNGQKLNFGYWSLNSNNISYLNGNVGIGTNNAITNLHVKSDFENSLIRIESNFMQSGLQLISSSNYNPFISFGTNGESGSKGGIYCDVINNQIVIRANKENYNFSELVIQDNGNLGVGTKFPKAKIEVSDGDVYVNNSNNGIILKSPNGQCWRVTIDNNGEFQKTEITCPE